MSFFQVRADAPASPLGPRAAPATVASLPARPAPAQLAAGAPARRNGVARNGAAADHDYKRF
jgi:hypothetical protein